MSDSNLFSDSNIYSFTKKSDTEELDVSQMNLGVIFDLMDSLISFECCLHYQVIPLVLQDDCLILGMVNIDDLVALRYVRSILNTLNYLDRAKLIPIKVHESILSAYLKRDPNNQPQPLVQFSSLSASSKAANSNAQTSPKSTNIHDRSTFIIKEEEEFERVNNTISVDKNTIHDLETEEIEFSPLSMIIVSEKEQDNKNQDKSAQEQSYFSIFPENLTPRQLSKELLSRVLSGGIGRLYFERHSTYGRILWSQDGVVQTTLEKLTPPIYQTILNDLKYLANLSLIPVQKIKKVEVEISYRKERLLLRLQLIPGKFGEEGTLQVLRGKALQFHEQRKIDEMIEQVVTLSQRLEKRIQHIYDRVGHNGKFRLEALKTLQNLEKEIKKQIELFDRGSNNY